MRAINIADFVIIDSIVKFFHKIASNFDAAAQHFKIAYKNVNKVIHSYLELMAALYYTCTSSCAVYWVIFKVLNFHEFCNSFACRKN